MNEPIWKILPKTINQQIDVVWRKWDDGKEESCLVTTPEYLAWLAEGNEPLPADNPQQGETP